ncbi:MAG TPA: hypothetical protein VHZ24_15590 [Pirellulales bacterium]|jgi:hypothetical protein|nr:hypothetical protein [Pirellulales bacterium]
MPDLLQTGSDWLADQLKANASQTVVYSRGDALLTVAAVIGRTVFETASDIGIVEQWEARDYLIQAADLTLGEPQRGDQITERSDQATATQGTATYVYEVMAPGNEPAYRFSDPYRKTYRIHTKLVATE